MKRSAQPSKAPGTNAGRLAALRQHLANIVFGLAVAALLVLPTGLAVVWLSGIGTKPIAVVAVQPALHFVPRDQVMGVLEGQLKAGFFGMDMTRMRAELVALPWVESAALRRVWPDRLEVTLREHVPAARWGERQLVSFEGVVFEPRVGSIPPDLPRLSGPQGSVDRVLGQYRRYRELLSVVGLVARGIALDERGSWRAVLDSGLQLLLGREHTEARLWRMARVYAQAIAPRLNDIERLDLRYSNGFAVSWRESA